MKQFWLSVYRKHRNLILYGIIGLSGATLDFLLYALFYERFHIPPFIASFLSVSVAIANNFFWNHRHNFKKTGHLLSRFASFYITGLGGALLSVLLIFIFFNLLGINALIAKLLTIVPVVLLQFFINKSVSFSDDPNKIFRMFKDTKS